MKVIEGHIDSRLILLWLLCPISVFTEKNQPRIKYFNLKNGLSQDSSNELLPTQVKFRHDLNVVSQIILAYLLLNFKP